MGHKWEGNIHKWEAVIAPTRPASNKKARKSQANPDAAIL
jgi:hypothetical protein